MVSLHKFLSTLCYFCLLLFSLSISSKRVPIQIYYDSLSLEVAIFIANFIARIEANNLISVVDLHLSPWGTKTVQCHNGKKECLLNTIEACALNVWKDQGKYLEFIHCVEYTVANETSSQWESCFEAIHMDRTPVDECYRSGLGTKLALHYAKERKALKPPMEYTPWVVVDGKPLYHDFHKWVRYVCKDFKGSLTPEGCKEGHKVDQTL